MAQPELTPPTTPIYALPDKHLPPEALLRAIVVESAAVAEKNDAIASSLREYAEKLVEALITLPDELGETRYSGARILGAHVSLSQVPLKTGSNGDFFVRTAAGSSYLRTPILDDFIGRVVRATYPTKD